MSDVFEATAVAAKAVTIDGKTAVTTRQNAEIIRRAATPRLLEEVEACIFGPRQENFSRRHVEHRRERLHKSISRARGFLRENFGEPEHGWLRTYSDRLGRRMVVLR